MMRLERDCLCVCVRVRACASQAPSPDEEDNADPEEVATADPDEDVDLSDMRVAPGTFGRSSHLSKLELARLRYEQVMSQAADVPWCERGPRRTQSHRDAPHWRGQPWREGLNGGKSRYAKRGGRYKEHYAEKARLGLVGGDLGTKGKNFGKGEGKAGEDGDDRDDGHDEDNGVDVDIDDDDGGGDDDAGGGGDDDDVLSSSRGTTASTAC